MGRYSGVEVGPAHPTPPAVKYGPPDPDSEFDELWIQSCSVHIERMTDTSFWIGFNLPHGRLVLNTGVDKDGVWFFSVEEELVPGSFRSVERLIDNWDKTLEKAKKLVAEVERMQARFTDELQRMEEARNAK